MVTCRCSGFACCASGIESSWSLLLSLVVNRASSLSSSGRGVRTPFYSCVRSAEEHATESGQQERSGGCTQTERPASRGTSHAGVPRRVRGAHTAGAESQLSHALAGNQVHNRRQFMIMFSHAVGENLTSAHCTGPACTAKGGPNQTAEVG
jgi:hypothetical protein